jgi:hypothetical protein
MGRETFAGLKEAGLNVVGEGIDEGEVLGFSARGYGGGPYCHKINLSFDNYCVNDIIVTILA